MKKKNNLKPIPKFKNEKEEWIFWQNHDSTEYFNYSKSKNISIEFDASVEKPVKLVSIRLPLDMLLKLKMMAIKRDVPYQSLIKMILAEKLEQKSFK